jgi:hypothetical protein
MEEEMKVHRVWFGKAEAKNHLEDHDIDGIRMDLRKIGWGSVGWIQLA